MKRICCTVNVLIGILIISCQKEPDTVAVESVTLDITSVTITEGRTSKVVAMISPENATNKKILWTTSNSDVATVSEGIITAVAPGSATIIAKSDDGGKKASCSVTVKAALIPVSGVTLDKTSTSLKADETVTLTATVSPDDATDKTVTWSTTDATIATVDDGVVTAKKVGTATITAKAGDKTATCEITVVPTPVTSISLSQTSASLKVDETVTLTATVSPDDATDKTVIWNTSDNSIASVSNGVVTANRIGNVTITASSADGTKKATCSVKVYSENPESGGNEDISIEDWD